MAVISKTFSIANISIQASADTVEKRIRSLNGIRFVHVALTDNTMLVEYDPAIIDEKMIVQTVRACGYDAYTKEMPALSEETGAEQKNPLIDRKLILSAAACLGVLILHFIPYSFWPCVMLSFVSFYTNFTMIRESFTEIVQNKKPGPASLRLSAYIISLIAGFIYGFKNGAQATMFLFTACAIVFFSAFEKKLIEHSRVNAARSMLMLKESLPKTAAVYQDRHEKIASVDELREDQIIMIRPGEVIPADGRVVRGFATMNESALTGMETPIEKSEGSYVYANSVCISGSVEIRAERTGSATAMMRLASLAEKTASDDSFQSPFKSFGRYLLVYIVIAACIAASGWLFSGKDPVFALNVLISVLCCASMRTLALSSENEVMNAATEAMTNHVIFRSVEALEMTGKTDNTVIEQSGAVTDHELVVTDFICAEGMSTARLEYIAYALESRSDRPFARAITRYLRSRRMEATDLAEFTQLSRRGRHAIQSLSSYRSYSYDKIVEHNIEHSEWEDTIFSLRSEGKRVLIFTEDGRIIGVIAAMRPLIPGAEEALTSLKEAGSEIWLLSDGTADESRVLADRLNPDHVLYLPEKEETEALLSRLNEEDSVTVFISEHPEKISTENADITVAIGTGAEPEAPAAGIWLTRNRLSDFMYAFRLSRELNDRIARKQMSILIYHAIAVLLFGFLLPAMYQITLPPVLALIAACAALYMVITTKKEFR